MCTILFINLYVNLLYKYNMKLIRIKKEMLKTQKDSRWRKIRNVIKTILFVSV